MVTFLLNKIGWSVHVSGVFLTNFIPKINLLIEYIIGGQPIQLFSTICFIILQSDQYLGVEEFHHHLDHRVVKKIQHIYEVHTKSN